jgi:hypothetical protein
MLPTAFKLGDTVAERERMANTPKPFKHLLREHAGEAHEEELRRALVPVGEAFKR